MLYRPWESLSVARKTPVPVFFALIAAPGIDAPELSVTVPVMLAVAACPRSFCMPRQANRQRLNAETARSLENLIVFNCSPFLARAANPLRFPGGSIEGSNESI